MEEFVALLDGAPADSASAEQLYERLVGAEQGLHSWIRTLVATKDRHTLQILYAERTTLHQLIDEHSPPYGRPTAALGFPYRADESAHTHAMRALAALGLAQLDPNSTECLDAAARWHATTNAAIDGAETSLVLTAGLAALSPGSPRRQRAARVGVLLAAGRDSQPMELRATHDRHLPRGIAPDPRTMSTFTADPQFHAALGTAYALAGRRLPGGVLYSLHADGRAAGHVIGESMGAAACVALDELASRRSWRWPLRIRRLRASTYLVGKVSPSGLLESVTQYAAKARDLTERSRLIVPQPDTGQVPEFGGALVGVSTWQEAAKAARRIDRWAVATRVLAVALVVAIAATFFGVQQMRRAERDRDLQVASRLANEANARIRGDSDGTALLLAMASDDLARSHGRPSSVFDDLARDYASLVSIVRPAKGRYQLAAIAPDGVRAMLATASGLIQIVTLQSGAVEWERQYPPGTELTLPRQVLITALAFGDDGYAAFATNERRVVLLQRTGSVWREATTVDLDVPSIKYSSQMELNYADHLVFHRRRLLALGHDPSFGLLSIPVADSRATQHRCPAEKANNLAVAAAGTALLTYDRDVVSIDPETCARRTMLTAPAGVQLHVAEADKTGIVGLGTAESRILAVRPNRQPVELADDGPYTTVRLSKVGDDLAATASTTDGTFGWRLAESAQVFGLRSSGMSLVRGDYLLWLHDGIAEVHSPGRNLFAAVRNFYYPAITMVARWAGPHLLLGRARGGVTLVRDATDPNDDELALDTRLPVPDKLNDVRALAADPDGTTAAAIVMDTQQALSHTLVVWDLSTLTPMNVELPPGTVPISLAYLGSRLFVGARGKQVFALERRDNTWLVVGTTSLNGNPAAVAASAASGTVGVITANATEGPATVATIDGKTSAVLTERQLPEASGPWTMLALRGGGFVTAYGTGKVVFLDSSLVITGMVDNLGLPYVEGVTQVAGRDEIMVSAGMFKTATIDVPTRSVLRDERWGRAGSVMGADASHDQRYFVTYDWTNMTFTVWVTDPSLLRHRACAVIGRELTQDEWRQYAGDNVPYRKVCQK